MSVVTLRIAVDMSQRERIYQSKFPGQLDFGRLGVWFRVDNGDNTNVAKVAVTRKVEASASRETLSLQLLA